MLGDATMRYRPEPDEPIVYEPSKIGRAIEWVRMFRHARRARAVDREAAYWWYVEIECRWRDFIDQVRPHSRRQCADCRRLFKRWWRAVDHSECDELPF